MSIDSAKDSGIGCSSSFSEDEKLSDRKINIIEYLPPNSYFRNSSRCYVFPGAEIYYNSDDDDEECDDVDNDIDDSGHFTQFDDEDSAFGPTTLTADSILTTTATTTTETTVSAIAIRPELKENDNDVRPQITESKWSKCNFNLGKDFKC